MLLLNEENVNQVLTMKDAMEVIETSLILQDKGDYIQPDRTFNEVKENSNFGLMPCFTNECIGLKVTATFPDNRESPDNIPVTQGMVMINDIHSGEFLSAMNGTLLTAVKTGAVSGTAIKYLKNDAESVGLVGTGLQGLYQLTAATEAAPIKQIYLYNRSKDKINEFIKEFKELIEEKEIEIVPVESIEALVDASEIIITATTSSTPVLPGDLNYNHKLIVAVGAYKPHMREIPEEIFKAANELYVDSPDGKRETGDIMDPLTEGWVDRGRIIPISDLVSSKHTHESDEAPIVFKNVNMALYDTMIAYFVYQEAKKQGIGTTFDF